MWIRLSPPLQLELVPSEAGRQAGDQQCPSAHCSAPSPVSQPEGLPLHVGSFPVTRGCCWHDRGEEYSANCFAAHLKATLDLI